MKGFRALCHPVRLLLYVACLMPGESSVRHKEPRAIGPEDALYEPLSQGQCVILGENPSGALVYGLLFQRLPIEIVEALPLPLLFESRRKKFNGSLRWGQWI